MKKPKPVVPYTLPEGYTEKEVIDTILRISTFLAKKFKFGYHEQADMIHEGVCFGLSSLSKFDTSRKLDSFIYSHIKKRFINFKRDHYRRSDPPCRPCYDNRPDLCSFIRVGEKMCKPFEKWLKRNRTKQHLMTPSDISCIAEESEPRLHKKSEIVYEAMEAELLEKIDGVMPIELRPYWLQLRDGKSVPTSKRMKVFEVITTCLNVSADRQ